MQFWSKVVRAVSRNAERHETKVRFILAGGFNTVFGLAFYPLLMWVCGPHGLHYMLALVISQISCVIVAYVTQKLLVFRTKGGGIREFLRFSSFYMVYFLVVAGLLPILVEIFHVNPVLAQFFLSIAVIFMSYFWHSRITFKQPKVQP